MAVLPLEVYKVFSSVMKASCQGGAFRTLSAQGSLGPDCVHCVFSNRDFHTVFIFFFAQFLNKQITGSYTHCSLHKCNEWLVTINQLHELLGLLRSGNYKLQRKFTSFQKDFNDICLCVCTCVCACACAHVCTCAWLMCRGQSIAFMSQFLLSTMVPGIEHRYV